MWYFKSNQAMLQYSQLLLMLGFWHTEYYRTNKASFTIELPVYTQLLHHKMLIDQFNAADAEKDIMALYIDL